MTIRTAVPADCGEVYRLICILEETSLPRPAFDAVWEAQRAQPERYRCLVCEEDGKLLSVLNMRMEQQLHHAARPAAYRRPPLLRAGRDALLPLLLHPAPRVKHSQKKRVVRPACTGSVLPPVLSIFGSLHPPARASSSL